MFKKWKMCNLSLIQKCERIQEDDTNRKEGVIM